MAIFQVQSPLIFAFGILGNIVSIFVFLAPLPTFIQICRKKSTLGFKSLPYVVALFSSMLWIYYALVQPNSILLLSVNSIGCFIETIYIVLFLIYAPREARIKTVKVIVSLNMLMFSFILLFTLFVFKDSNRVQVVGWACVIVSIGVFAAPLSILYQVCRTKSVEFLPITLSFFLTLSAVMWFTYGLLKKDLYVALPNVFGFILGLVQMILYGIYRKNKKVVIEIEIDQTKVPEGGQEHIINMGMVGIGSEVHPVDAPNDGEVQPDQHKEGDEEHENKHDQTDHNNHHEKSVITSSA